ncbi:hypothetical protein BU23DRAFT_574625 [Bimuria novae-zelandiae CBS 107.79]|uniref:Uncharacterized protein n=1 Tax=Bimuria novae-zelandiae CBS 107.79 TaxID=1447943 RepID=A0A6A5ULS7_9PLEO|nr:hypothetical protein BU23DRAFT_574625 [Bimuria novae-zelandiae CBS 107.79]
MFSEPRSLLKATVLALFTFEASAVVLKPIVTVPKNPAKTLAERDNKLPGVQFVPIRDPGEVTGRFTKREKVGNSCYDPSSENEFLWGAYAGDNLYMANFTLRAPQDEELILPIENFAKELKSIKCGKPGEGMTLTFQDQQSYDYAQKQWKWVDDEDINHFILVTEPDQCYQGDDRSPYLVKTIDFDSSKLTACLKAEEVEWKDVAMNFHLSTSHEYVDPNTANVTHPQLVRKDEDAKFDLSMNFDQPIFNFGKESDQTSGLSLSANAKISTGGSMVADFEIDTFLGFPTDVSMRVYPQGVYGQIMLELNADGTLGRPLDWALTPEIEIPVGALNIKGILELGPYITMGVHLGSSALTGTATWSAGAKASLKDSAEVKAVLLGDGENSIKDWDPVFEKIDPTFSAEIGGDVRAWGELGVQFKAEVLGGVWGYQASVDAELPYFEAKLSAQVNSEGVCGTQKTLGVEVDAGVGINVNLNMGQIDKSPDFQKDLFDTRWPLFSTCMGFGPDVQTPTPTPEATPTEEPDSTLTAEPTDAPVSTDAGGLSTPGTEHPTMVITTGPPLATSTGMVGTGTVSGGFPNTANSTFIKMARRKPTVVANWW